MKSVHISRRFSRKALNIEAGICYQESNRLLHPQLLPVRRKELQFDYTNGESAKVAMKGGGEK